MEKFSRIAYFMVVFGMVVNLMVERGEALSRGDLGASVSQCSSYATGAVGEPSTGCCSAVKGVYAMAKTAEDRKVLCNCLKQSSSAVPGVQLSNVAAIPQKCGVPVSSPNPNFNFCNKTVGKSIIRLLFDPFSTHWIYMEREGTLSHSVDVRQKQQNQSPNRYASSVILL